MATVLLKDGRSLKVSREQGHEIWHILQGEQEATPDQEKFVLSIDRILLSFYKAPDSYISKHLKQFIEWSKRDWLVDYSGRPTRPQTSEQWDLARKYGFAP